MAFDPRTFAPMVVTDTCAVWNVLSARKLYQAAFDSGLTFCITPMVLFECIRKPRKNVTPEQTELINRFHTVQKAKGFDVLECDLEALFSVSTMAPAGLSSGELSCIAMSYRISTIAVMTDERQARYFAENKLALRVETTPRLYGWLHYQRHLVDGDHSEILEEHAQLERRPLTEFFETAYSSALQYRLIEQQAATAAQANPA